MNNLPSRQVFYTIDPVTLLPMSTKDRIDVHEDGDWHMAVTAFIFRVNLAGKIEVLIQERSEYVDIAQKHFDQSLATQLLLEDENDTEMALFRGLKEELDLHNDDIHQIQLWNTPGSVYISKQYKYNPELWNREIVSNYLIQIKYDAKMSGNFKVLGLEWLPWEEVCNLVRVRPNKFTKSVRLYCVCSDIANDIYEKMSKMAESDAKIPDFTGKIFYDSLADMDIIAVKTDGSSDWVIEVYSTDYSMSKQRRIAKKEITNMQKLLFADDNGVTSTEILKRLGVQI